MILITGAAGYIGSHCALCFSEYGLDDILIFDNLSTGHIETVYELQKINPKIKFIQGDLKNKEDISSVFKKFQIDSVIHFAALSQVKESVVNPSLYYSNNVLGTVNLLNSMIENNILKIVFSSTAATYGEPKYTPIDENHPQIPINPYGSTKLMIEKIMDDYDKAYNLKSIRLRYFNVIGADEKIRIGEWHNPETHLVPNILKSVFNKTSEFKIFGNDYDTKDGTCIRDYVDVLDLADAHRLALDYLNKFNKTDVFNLGTQEGQSVREIFNISQEVTRQEINFKIVEKREGDPKILLANSSKAKEILNWKPKRTTFDSIKNAFEWEKVLFDKLKASN